MRKDSTIPLNEGAYAVINSKGKEQIHFKWNLENDFIKNTKEK